MILVGKLLLAVAISVLIALIDILRSRKRVRSINSEVNSIACDLQDKDLTLSTLRRLHDKVKLLKAGEMDWDEYKAVLSLESRIIGLKKYHF